MDLNNREKVIKKAERIMCSTVDRDMIDSFCEDVIDLLKEQEPKQIVRMQEKRENSDGSIDYFAEWYCPHCGKLLKRGFDAPWIEFCYKCGKAVKWT